MNPPQGRTRLLAYFLIFILLLLLLSVVWRAVAFIATGEPGAILFGLGVLCLPLLVGWGIIREVKFGVGAQRLGAQLAHEGGLPLDDLPRRPSGRIERAAADAAFEPYRLAAAEHPEDWRAWYRLGLAYDACGDRRRARSAIRTALARAGAPGSAEA